jgi:uncharacterized protein YbjQ (UPF0145 family)
MWDGRGLPPVAAERVRRAAAGGAWTSLLSAPAMAGLEVAGFDPVGEVFGSMVKEIDRWGSCDGGSWFGRRPSETVLSSTPIGRKSGYQFYVGALDIGYRTAMARMLTEASAIGADGVVGVILSKQQVGDSSDTHEFTAIGTAVRARSRIRPGRVFCTHLPGQDLAKLVAAGWVPVDMVFGISIGIRHDDRSARRQRRWRAGNVEVTGYTELVTLTRADARKTFAKRLRRTAADGAIVSSLDLVTRAIEHSGDHTDHLAEAMIFGTAVAQFHPSATAPTRSLTYLPLR